MKTRTLLAGFAAAVAFAGPAAAADVICYNCPPEWADWGTMLKAIKADLKLDVPHDNKTPGRRSHPDRTRPTRGRPPTG
jgi:putative spermidine/putrescine transport system substrate-binding protein